MGSLRAQGSPAQRCHSMLAEPRQGPGRTQSGEVVSSREAGMRQSPGRHRGTGWSLKVIPSRQRDTEARQLARNPRFSSQCQLSNFPLVVTRTHGIWRYSVSSPEQCNSNEIPAALTGCFTYRASTNNAASLGAAPPARQGSAASARSPSRGWFLPGGQGLSEEDPAFRERFCHRRRAERRDSPSPGSGTEGMVPLAALSRSAASREPRPQSGAGTRRQHGAAPQPARGTEGTSQE